METCKNITNEKEYKVAPSVVKGLVSRASAPLCIAGYSTVLSLSKILTYTEFEEH